MNQDDLPAVDTVGWRRFTFRGERERLQESEARRVARINAMATQEGEADLLTALRGEEETVVVIGSLIIVKVGGRFIIRFDEKDAARFRARQDLMSSPEAAAAELEKVEQEIGR